MFCFHTGVYTLHFYRTQCTTLHTTTCDFSPVYITLTSAPLCCLYSGNTGCWDWLTAPTTAPTLAPTTAPSSSSGPAGHSHSYDTNTSSSFGTSASSAYNECSMYYPLAHPSQNGHSDPSRGRLRAYADSLLSSPGECFDYAVARTRKLLRADLNAIIVDLCEGET